MEVQETNKFIEIKANEIWLKPYLSMEKRRLCEFNETSNETIIELEQKFKLFSEKTNKLVEQIEATSNKGSFLVKVQNFKTNLAILVGVGDYESLYLKLDEKENEILALVNQNRDRNLEIKKALLEETKITCNIEDLKKGNILLKDIKLRWVKTGDVSKDLKESIEGEFSELCQEFYERSKVSIETTRLSYEKLIIKSKDVVESSSLNRKEATESLKSIQKEWKELSNIPNIVYKELWGELSDIHDTYFTSSKVQNKQDKINRSLELKKEIIEEVIKLHHDIGSFEFEQLNDFRLQWKKAPYFKTKKEEEQYENFNYNLEKLLELNKLNKLENKLIKSGEKDGIKIKQEKVKLLKRIVRKEEENLEKMNDNLGNFRINYKSEGLKKMLNQSASRKDLSLIVKKDILEELKKC